MKKTKGIGETKDLSEVMPQPVARTLANKIRVVYTLGHHPFQPVLYDTGKERLLKLELPGLASWGLGWHEGLLLFFAG